MEIEVLLTILEERGEKALAATATHKHTYR
jgi:hypothetical protein